MSGSDPRADAPAQASAECSDAARPDGRALPRAAWIVAILGLLSLRLACLDWGFAFDDYTHQLVLRGEIEHDTLGPWSLFDFGGPPRAGDPGYEQGGFPFWADSSMRARFLRPLTSAWLTLDHALFGTWATGYHLSQLAAYALLLVLLARLYLRLGLSPRLALAALCVYGCEDGSVAPVGWIANRSTLLVALGLVSALLLLESAGRRGSLWRAAAALIAGLLALGAKESGLGVLLLLALAASGALGVPRPREEHSGVTRVVVLGACLIAVVYLLAYLLLGYGTHTAFYPTPWTDPQGFVSFLTLHLTAGIATCAGPVVTDLGLMHAALRPPVIAIGAVVLLLLIRPLRGSLRELTAGRLLLAIALVTFLPQTMAAPSDRLIFVPMVGWAPLLAAAIARGLRSAARSRRVAARVLVASTLVLSPLMLLVINRGFGTQIDLARESLVNADVGQGAGPREVFVLQAPFGTMMLSAGAARLIETGQRDVRLWPLQFSRRPLRIERVAPDRFEFETTGESFLTRPFEYVFRSTLEVPAVGTRYQMPLFDAEVLAVDARGPRKFAIQLRADAGFDLDAPQLRYLAWDGERLTHRPMPAVGESLELEEAPETIPLAP